MIDGAIDTYLVPMAGDIADWGRPIFWMYPREPCIQPGWGYDGGYGPEDDLTEEEAESQGYSLDGEYGNPDELDGPERYRDMCRHIHDVIAPLAPNITWVMGAIVARFEGACTQWYPGDAYVDRHAIDVYAGYGDDLPEPRWIYFDETVEPDWSEAFSPAPDKPFMIVELGVAGRDRTARGGFNASSNWLRPPTPNWGHSSIGRIKIPRKAGVSRPKAPAPTNGRPR